MNYKKVTMLLAIVGASLTTMAQSTANTEGVSIAPNVTPPHTSAMLDVSAVDKGVLIPRIALTGTGDVTTIPNPANSLLIYNNGTVLDPGYYYFDAANTTWTPLGGGGLWEEVNLNAAASGFPSINYDRLRYIGDQGELRFGMFDDKVAGGGGSWFTQTSTTYLNGGNPLSITYAQVFPDDKMGLTIRSFHNLGNPYSTAFSEGNLYLGSNTVGKHVVFHLGGSYAGHIDLLGFHNPSDSTLKTNVVTLQSSLAKIKQLRGVSYQWADPNSPQTTQFGFIAQELETVFPELVSSYAQPNPDGTFEAPTKNVNYIGLIAPLIEAIKEQQTKIEELEQRIQTLEGQ